MSSLDTELRILEARCAQFAKENAELLGSLQAIHAIMWGRAEPSGSDLYMLRILNTLVIRFGVRKPEADERSYQ